MFTFQFLTLKIDQNTNFVWIAKRQMAFFGITETFIIQKLKSKHLVCLSFFGER